MLPCSMDEKGKGQDGDNDDGYDDTNIDNVVMLAIG